MTESISTVDAYHQRSKHSLQQYAAGPGTLDWDAQPDPFRHFAGAEQFALPLLGQQLAEIRYADLYQAGCITPAAWTKKNLAALLELSYGLSAWKQYGPSRWSLRCNPSSGNLHPTEVYVVQHGMDDLPAGVFHYRVQEHALERRCAYTEGNSPPPKQELIIGLSSIHWREAWKYGERAWRYVQLDVGHAIACLRYAASMLGWQVTRLDSIPDQQISQLLGLDRIEDFDNVEKEQPDVLLAVSAKDSLSGDITQGIDELLTCNAQGSWQGRANLLDPRPMYEWPVIDEISALVNKDDGQALLTWQDDKLPALKADDNKARAGDVIKQRRSAQAFDGVTEMSRSVFYAMLDKLLPREAIPPWDCAKQQPRVHPVFFVHNVEGLPRGVYALPRYRDALSYLQANMRVEFKWQKPADCPAHIPLYLLIAANCQNAARTIACHQDIAADGAFSLAMLAEYDSVIDEGGHLYRQLYWEAGMLGQVLYLDAEAHNLRGTGIGCFFDDALHDTLGISDTSLQDVYHFTVGAPIIDQRLISLPPYGHLQGR